MNPSLDPAIIDEAYEDDPASAAAEYGAEFRSDIADFVPRETIDAVTVRGRLELLPVPACFTAHSSIHQAEQRQHDAGHRAPDTSQVGVLDAVREIRPPFSPQDVVQEFAAFMKDYRVHEVVGDRYAGEWPREQFREAGIGYRLSDQPNGEIYRDTLPLLNSGKVELLDLPRLAQPVLRPRTPHGAWWTG